MSAAAPPLVGRDAELRALERALERTGGGTSQALGISGEPGIGKSRLLGELGRRAASRGHLVAAGRAAELERDVPFALWVEALDDHIVRAGREALAGLGEDLLAELAVALPSVARVAGVAPAMTGERHLVARAVRGLLERMAAARPVTVLLDDVHWADPASVDVITLLLHRLPEGAVLLAMTTRTGRSPAVEDALHAAERHGDAVALELGTLSREAVDTLLAPSLGTTVRARLFRESGGNPFYLQALASAGAATATARAATVGAGVPRAVASALAGEISVARGEHAAPRAGRRSGRRSVRADARGGSGRDGRGGGAGSSRRRAGGRPAPGHRPATALQLPASARAPGRVRGGGRRLEAGRTRAGGRDAGSARRDGTGAGAPRGARGPAGRHGCGRAAVAGRRADGPCGARNGGRVVRGRTAAATRVARARRASSGVARCPGLGSRVRRTGRRGTRRPAPAARAPTARRSRRARGGCGDARRAGGAVDAAARRGSRRCSRPSGLRSAMSRPGCPRR